MLISGLEVYMFPLFNRNTGVALEEGAGSLHLWYSGPVNYLKAHDEKYYPTGIHAYKRNVFSDKFNLICKNNLVFLLKPLDRIFEDDFQVVGKRWEVLGVGVVRDNPLELVAVEKVYWWKVLSKDGGVYDRLTLKKDKYKVEESLSDPVFLYLYYVIDCERLPLNKDNKLNKIIGGK